MHTQDTVAQLEASAYRSQMAYRDQGPVAHEWAAWRAEAVRPPALLIWGAHDVTAMPDEVAARLVKPGPGPDREWCVIPGGGHWIQYERPNDVNQLLKAWFLPQQGDMQ